MDMDAVSSIFLAQGPWGAAVAALAVAFWHQLQENKRVQEARVADAQKVTTTLLDITAKFNESTQEMAEAVNGLSGAVEELREDIRKAR